MTELVKTEAAVVATAGDGAAIVDAVTLTIDGMVVRARKGALLIRVAEQLGIEIPRFCDHPLLAPAGACRQCLVEVEGQRKPVASCTQPVIEGMVVRTQHTSEVAAKAQEGVMEFLLINHPLDCPMCDKGGECPLQNQAMSTGRTDTRFVETKRTFAKPIHVSSQVLLDRERCVLCQRCTRFCDEISGDRFIDLMDRSSGERIGIEEGVPFHSYFSGNTIQICPVGALTDAQYRFRARPFDLVSTPSVCEHCSAGCALRTDHRRGKVMRRLAGEDPLVNEEWSCDRGRWGFQYAVATDRLTAPLVRDENTGVLRQASWPEALRVAAEGLRRARDGAYRAGDRGGANGSGVGVLTGGRLTVEDAYAYAKFARAVLQTNDIDFRARPIGAGGEEAAFLAACVAGVTGVGYAQVQAAPAVVLVGLDTEDECPILFLRLRKAAQAPQGATKIYAVAPWRSPSLAKLSATVVVTVPGDEARALAGNEQLRAALSQPGALLLVGERLAQVAGGLSAAAALAGATGAKLAWVPRRAGDRGAVDAGCLPNLLPGGRPVTDAAARAELGLAWGLRTGVIPGAVGRDIDAIMSAAAAGKIGALVVAGVDPGDLADPRLAEQALDRVDFLVCLELRESAATRRADVVFPVAPAAEKAGAYLDWEGRLRPFTTVLETVAMTDARILDALAGELGVALGCADVAAVRRELVSLPSSRAVRPSAPAVAPAAVREQAGPEQAVLATWRRLLDGASLLHATTELAGTAPPERLALSRASAVALGIADGATAVVSTHRGRVAVPAEHADLPDGVVFLPSQVDGVSLAATLGVGYGAVVSVAPMDGGGAR